MNQAPLHIDVRLKRFANGHIALEGLQLDVAPGEFVAVVGPSGCGKSTLLSLLAGLDEDFQGSIRGVPREALGMMFQEPRLMPWLSVRDNLRLVCPNVSEPRLHALLAAVELPDVANHFPQQLSGGMARRIALARAFIVQPRLLLMDEPFTGLDAPTATRLRAQLLQLWSQQQAAVVFVTHQLQEALALADRVVFLSASPARVIWQHRREPGQVRHSNPQTAADLAQALLADQPDLLQGRLRPTT